MNEDNKDSATVLNPNDLLTLAERVGRFNDELKALLGKYELALSGEAFIVDGKVLAKPVVADARGKKENGGYWTMM